MTLQKFILSTLLLFSLASLSLLTATPTKAATAQTVLVEQNDPHVQLGEWYADPHSQDKGGYDRYADNAGETAQFKFSGMAVTWYTHEGPYEGIAKVLIDGVDKGTFDLYTPTDHYQHPIQFKGLTNSKHTIRVKVLGRSSSKSNGYNEIPIDAFGLGSTLYQESSNLIRYDSWKTVTNSHASGGNYVVSAKKNASVVLYADQGTKTVNWITATGPTYGMARVTTGTASGGVIDLYSPTQQWNVVKTFTVNTASPYVEIQVLAQKNPSSQGKKVVVDGFKMVQ